MSYYDRKASTHVDGSLVFQSAEDRDNERTAAARLEAAWNCRITSFGALSPIDWFAQRDGRLTAVLELKSRSHAHDRFDTVFLNVRKWLALSLGAIGLGCPALFVVQFLDGIYWINAADIDARTNRIAGCARVVKAKNDIEPVIEVPVASMNKIPEA